MAEDSFLTTDCAQAGVIPAAADQKDSNGQPIVPKAAEGKKSVPVILVHGWNGAANTFSSPISLFADSGDGGDGIKIPFSFIGRLQKTPGLAVYTFDYSAYSNRWVDDANIGPKLAQAIECLTNHYGTKAQIVAHSMGGLATRYALDQNDSGGAKMSTRVSGVSTFGTPNTGSEIATAVAGALGLNNSAPPSGDNALRVAGWLLAKICGRQITAGTKTLTAPCSLLPSWAAGLDSDAATAMRVGSAQLAALPTWPSGITVTAIDGKTMIHGISLFGAVGPASGLDAGDMIVPVSSATAGSTTTKELNCGYAIRAQDKTSKLLLKSVGMSMVVDGPIDTILGENPCYHTNLLRTINGTNVAAAAVRAAASDPQPVASTSETQGSPSPSPTETAADTGAGTDGPGWYSLQKIQEVSYEGDYGIGDITIRTTPYPDSLYERFTGIPAEYIPRYVDWPLKGMCTKLKVAVGINAESPVTTGSPTFSVLVDDRVAARVQHGYYDQPQQLDLNVSGVTRLRLQLDFPRSPMSQAAWGSPRVYCSANPSPK
jgi:pimeloyl-ACP methyl ester carboxylesterase